MNERRSHLILMGLIIAALIGVAVLALPGSPLQRTPTLGLDLQGGLEVVKKAVPEKGETVDEAGLDDAVTIINDRINGTGVSEPEIREQGSDQIVIELPGVDDQQRAADLIGQTAKLELYDLQGDLIPGVSLDLQGFPIAARRSSTSFRRSKPRQRRVTRRSAISSRPRTRRRKSRHGCSSVRRRRAKRSSRRITSRKTARRRGTQGHHGAGRARAHGRRHLQRDRAVLRRRAGCAEPHVLLPLQVRPAERGEPDPGDDGLRPEAHGHAPGLRYHDERAGRPHAVHGRRGEEVPGHHADARRAREKPGQPAGLPGGAGNDNANQQFAIVLDREMKSAPSVGFDDNPNGIPGNNGAQITGIAISDAKDLALVLRSGALPFKLITIEQTDISATLGKDSLPEAKKAAIGGLIVVALFLLLFYRFLGLVAVIGLGIYAAFLYAAMLLFNVTLSLPGSPA